MVRSGLLRALARARNDKKKGRSAFICGPTLIRRIRADPWPKPYPSYPSDLWLSLIRLIRANPLLVLLSVSIRSDPWPKPYPSYPCRSVAKPNLSYPSGSVAKPYQSDPSNPWLKVSSVLICG
jgi:hypothetical protein